MKTYLFFLAFLLTSLSFSQEDISWDDDEEPTDKSVVSFLDTRVVNGQSTEVLEPKTLDFRVSHKFGDMATAGAYHRLYGLDNSSDIRIAFEYGVFKNFNIGLGRSKGAGPLTEVFDGFAKYKILQQNDKMPLSLTVVGAAYASGAVGDTLSYTVTNYSDFSNRFSYYTQLLVSTNIKDWVTVQLAPGLSYRNLVYNQDQNALFSLGGSLKMRITKKIALLTEYFYTFRNQNTFLGTEFVNPLGFGIEIKTHAHVFQINITNARGFGEGQFIPYTSSKYADGEFRLGFKISRHFNF
ncbi:MAG: hypothetical protein HUJ25_15265 [Crocinitomicaceae bacterium]|nr:hypothetical protein [Crocinitomicaceae bacterium]